MKQKLVETEEWKRLIERTITDKEIIDIEIKRMDLQRFGKTKSQEKGSQT